MLGVYLSGTGNTKHCIEKLVKMLDQSAKVIPLENKNVISEINSHDTIILGYPTQFSNAPIMIRDFIKANDIWKDKRMWPVVFKFLPMNLAFQMCTGRT